MALKGLKWKIRFCGLSTKLKNFPSVFFNFDKSCVPKRKLEILARIFSWKFPGRFAHRFVFFYWSALLDMFLKSALLKIFRKFQKKYQWRIAYVFALKKEYFSTVSMTLCDRSNFAGNFANLNLTCLVTNFAVQTEMRKEVVVQVYL